MSDGPSLDRLATLRERWQADPTSRLFLQLAEEHRGLGQSRQALEVLDAGLKHHPAYFAALVAKGRCHLELGEAAAAREALERAVRLDAMNAAASKLLVRALLAEGEAEKARERLDLYSLLNDGDPEIAELRRAIAGRGSGQAGSPAAQGTPEPFPAADLPEALPPLEDDEEAEDDVFDLAAAATAPEPAPAWPIEPPLPASGGGGTGAADEPFADLLSPADARRYLEGLASEGIFGVFGVEQPAPPEPVPAVTPASPVAAPDEDDIFGLGPRPVPDLGGELFGVPDRRAERHPEPPPAPAPVPPAPAPVTLVEEDTLSLVPPPAAPAAASPPAVAEAPPGRAAEASATVTLGELYLRQGHAEEAVRIFREVLRRDPGNAGAHEALERIEGRPLSAADLLAGFAGPDEPRARKVHLLDGYLKRLRRRSEGSRPDVP